MNIDEFKARIEFEKSDIQNLESCIGKDFDINQWLSVKKSALDYIVARLEDEQAKTN